MSSVHVQHQAIELKIISENTCRVRIEPGIFARARSFALKILHVNGENTADALWRNALDLNRPIACRYKQSALNSPARKYAP